MKKGWRSVYNAIINLNDLSAIMRLSICKRLDISKGLLGLTTEKPKE